MKLLSYSRKLLVLEICFLALGELAVQTNSAWAGTQPERFWLAGRYDGNRVIVYFEAARLNGTVPATAKRIPNPVVGGFFMPMELPAAYVAGFLKGHEEREHFALGDKYDLLLDYGTVATVTLTTLVGTEGWGEPLC